MITTISRVSMALAVLAACRRGDPPAAADVDGAVAPLPPPAVSGAAASPDAGRAPSKDTAPAASSAASASAADAGDDPGALPQTRDKPGTSGAFEARSKTLWDGIVADDPEKAMPFFFPLKAYEQVKAIGEPAGDWRRRLVAAYKRDIHALHKRLGEHAEDAKLVRFDVPEDRAKWVEPGDEYNKLGYYRVYGTRIVYEVGGKERSFEISSLISWRGEWYCVHLTGFK